MIINYFDTALNYVGPLCGLSSIFFIGKVFLVDNLPTITAGTDASTSVVAIIVSLVGALMAALGKVTTHLEKQQKANEELLKTQTEVLKTHNSISESQNSTLKIQSDQLDVSIKTLKAIETLLEDKQKPPTKPRKRKKLDTK